jgi:oxygen-independent coproporphyrinogen-3 oxidase
MQDALIERYSRPVPRYTSYPTAPHFAEGFTGADRQRWIAELPRDSTLSLYLHIPFCDRLCWFCGCHTKQILRYGPIAAYLPLLHAEITMAARQLDGNGKVTSIHLGGGSPSMLSPEDFLKLGRLFRDSFAMPDDLEFSIEVDPNDMDPPRYDALARMGVTRISLGVQDFNPQVQTAVNRIQTYEQTRVVVDSMRRRNVNSVNLDILYGLPHQTTASLEATVMQALSLDPDRMAVFGYAHVPWLKPHQRMIDEAALPDGRERFEQAQAAAAIITAAGYEPVGFDHFAKPADSLARAARQGRLHRNFQGYTTDKAAALFGFGASAISKFPQGYLQNTVPTANYQRQVADNGTAVARGYLFTNDDRIRGYVIERLMCDFAVSLRDVEACYGAAAERVMAQIAAFAEQDFDNLTAFDGDRLAVTRQGRPFVRSIAAAFDAYLPADNARYSPAV